MNTIVERKIFSWFSFAYLSILSNPWLL